MIADPARTRREPVPSSSWVHTTPVPGEAVFGCTGTDDGMGRYGMLHS